MPRGFRPLHDGRGAGRCGIGLQRRHLLRPGLRRSGGSGQSFRILHDGGGSRIRERSVPGRQLLLRGTRQRAARLCRSGPMVGACLREPQRQGRHTRRSRTGGLLPERSGNRTRRRPRLRITARNRSAARRPVGTGGCPGAQRARRRLRFRAGHEKADRARHRLLRPGHRIRLGGSRTQSRPVREVVLRPRRLENAVTASSEPYK